LRSEFICSGVVGCGITITTGVGFFCGLSFSLSFLVWSVHESDVLADNSNEVSEESNDNESFSEEGEDVLFLSILSVVGVIVGITSTDVDNVSLVDGKVEDDLPCGPEED
jgi:hypothetical protein